MKIKFLKEYRAIGDFGMPGKAIIVRSIIGDTADNLDDEDAQWLIDNGFAEEVKESGWWKPKYCEKYFYIGHDGSVYNCVWINDLTDNTRLKLGSVFKTEEAAMRYRDYWEAVATVRQDEGVLTPEQIRNEYYGSYIHYIGVDQFGQLRVDWKSLYDETTIASAIYFDTQDHAQTSLDEHPDEWKIIANYDWSRE